MLPYVHVPLQRVSLLDFLTDTHYTASLNPPRSVLGTSATPTIVHPSIEIPLYTRPKRDYPQPAGMERNIKARRPATPTPNQTLSAVFPHLP
jgi:hypothetical protein